MLFKYIYYVFDVEEMKFMKIAMPVNESAVNSTVCVSFGRTPYFMIYDTETKKYDFIENDAANSQGGAGIKAAQLIVDSKVDALLTPRCGKNAADVMDMSNIKLFKTIGESIVSNLNDFGANELPLLTEIHAGFHNHGEK